MTVLNNGLKDTLLSIQNILSWTGGTCLQFSEHLICTGVFTDSRKVIPGGLFIALKGENFNGHQFVVQALQKGAAAALVSEPLEVEVQDKAVIYVTDTLEALQALAHGYRRQFQDKVKLAAVTGSVGKTTTKDLLAWCLSKKYLTLKTMANHNNDIGVPETLFQLGKGYQAAVVEMGMRARGEIERLSRIAEPDVVLITNVAPVHLETLGSLENIAKAKCEIFSALNPKGWGMIAGDCDLLCQEVQKTGCNFYTFGTNPGSDCWLQKTEIHMDGMKLYVKIFNWTGVFVFPIPSQAVALDVVAAAGCAYLLGLTPEEIAQALADYVGDGQRLHVTRFPEGGLVLNDTYNANPLSMAEAVDVLCCQAGSARKIAVLGDMYELGALEQQGHEQVGEKIAKSSIDCLVTVGVLGQMIAQGAKKYGMSADKIISFPDNETALPWLKTHVDFQDAVLFKASHGLHLDILLKQWENGGEKSRG